MRTRLTVILAGIVFAGPVAQGQLRGLLSGPRMAKVTRLVPPTINLAHRRIRIESKVVGRIADGDSLPNLLTTKLVAQIQHDPRITIDEVKPQTILSFAITNGYIETFQGTANGQSYTSYRGKIDVSYQALDAATKRALDSENLSETIGYDERTSNSWRDMFVRGSGENPPRSANEAWDRLVNKTVRDMGQRVAPIQETFEASLPGGKGLDPIKNKAMNGLWQEVIKDAEEFPPLPKPSDDADRTYLIALGKEVLAYKLAVEADDAMKGRMDDIPCAAALDQRHRSRGYLYESSKLYKDILQVKPSDKVFQAGQMRVSQALTTYDIIEHNQPNCDIGATPPPPPASNPLENILAFCKAEPKGSLPQIKEYIESDDFLRDAKGTDYMFKFPQDAIALAKDCGSSAAAIQSLMRGRLDPSRKVTTTKK
ncbi:MAG TPA: hypothetical protein VKU01_34560 [Bryobacteraceae bacterium]|nr:hypothetical protein [Bryobacteraceae bacterium]